MSNQEHSFAFETHEAIIRASSGRKKPNLPPNIVFLPVPEDFETCRKMLGAILERTLFHFMEIRTATFQGTRIGLAGRVLGAPQAVMLLENLVAMGARRLVFFGWCGSISPEVRIGDLILPTRAFSEEGTSRHYPLPGVRVRSDPGLHRALARKCARLTVSVREGAVWTTDAPYRETPQKVQLMCERGALAVEMELSALFKTALFRKIRLAALLVVSDELFSGKWKHGFKDPHFEHARLEGIRTALEVFSDKEGS